MGNYRLGEIDFRVDFRTFGDLPSVSLLKGLRAGFGVGSCLTSLLGSSADGIQQNEE